MSLGLSRAAVEVVGDLVVDFSSSSSTDHLGLRSRRHNICRMHTGAMEGGSHMTNESWDVGRGPSKPLQRCTEVWRGTGCHCFGMGVGSGTASLPDSLAGSGEGGEVEWMLSRD